MPIYEPEGTPDLDQTIWQLDLPSLEHLTIYYRSNGDSPAVRAFFECFLDIAARSKVADRLCLRITCSTDALSSLFARHQAFLKSVDILLCAAGSRLFSAPPAQSISLPNVQHLDVRCLEHVTKYLVAPKLRSLSTSYGGGDDSNHLVMLEPIASQLEKLTLNMGHWQPVSNGCPVPFVNLKELHIVNVLPRGSGTSLVLTPNLELLDVGHWIGSSVKLAIHCLGYILGPKGMLGPIRGLKTLRLGNLILSDKKKADYCTRHLRFHPLLENLTIHRSELPKDFLDLLPNPVSSPDEFLPNLKKIQFHQCSPTNPSNEWFAELARGRPLLTVISY
ncbi:hypothetical protein CPB86DRAFT_47640 [Serendipita vermifera]|nr:hypothetical protein CPB86DRAFT_47640 [Serendipita vermifera]